MATLKHARRGVLGVLLVVCLGVFAVAFYSADPVRPAHEPTQRPPRAAGTPQPATSTPGSVPTAGRSPPGIDLVATPRSDETFDVVETVQLRQPTDRLILAPPSAQHTGAAFSAFRPRADSVSVHADGHRVSVIPAEVAARRVVLLSSPAIRIELRYRLTGAIIRSGPSVPGRALGIAAPLTAQLDGSLPATLTFPRARNLLCPLLDPTRLLCARAQRGGMMAPQGLAADNATIVVQLDLPRTS